MKKAALLFLSLVLPLPAFAADYCLAVRGNGESVAAHWPAFARIIEENGLPSAGAGGSSGTISLFMLDSLLGNELVKNEKDKVKQREIAALLFKSMPVFLTEMARTDGLLDVYAFLQRLSHKDSKISKALRAQLELRGPIDIGEIQRLFGKYAPLLNPELLRNLMAHPAFFRGEAQKSLNAITNFDAREPNLFVRPGVLDFKYAALLMGTIADFYAGNADATTNRGLESFARDCAEPAYRKAWGEIPAACQSRFQTLVRAYVRAGNFPQKAIFEKIGQNLHVFPTTAIVSDQGAEQFTALSKKYQSADSSGDYAGFHVNLSEGELSFGYWGASEADLAKVDAGLEIFRSDGDEKTRHFRALGTGTWFEVLTASPAEPGLTNLQRIVTGESREEVLGELKKSFSSRWEGLSYRPGIYSAGGWSDLHPMQVLRASGCQHVAYVTRKGGDSVFSQQAFVRLSGEQKQVTFWGTLAENNDLGWPTSGSVATSIWNRLFNLANDGSSYNRALRLADAVYCTNWDHFAVFHGEMDKMTAESYAAPVFTTPGAPASFHLHDPASDASPASYPGCLPHAD